MPKKNVRLIFFIILFKDIFYYYIIILPLFDFQCGYGMSERSDFILTETNGYYNSNDRWKFILSFIKRDNGLNDWSKLIKSERKEYQK